MRQYACFAAVWLVICCFHPARAQFNPGGFRPPTPSPGGYRPPTPSRPSPHRPSRPTPSSPYNRPITPGSPYNRPTTPGSPYNRSNTPGSPYNPPGSPHQPQSPTQFRNPFFNRTTPTSPSRVQFGTTPQNRVYSSVAAPSDPQWLQIQKAAQQRNLSHTRQLINQQLERNRSLGGYMSAVSVLERAGASQQHLRTYRNQAMEMARSQIKTGSPSNPLPYVTIAKFSLEDQKTQDFRQAAQSLATKFPNDKHSHYFQGIVALQDGDWKQAEQRLRKARELGVPEESIAQWLKMAIDNQKWIWEYAQLTFYMLVGWVAGLILLYVFGKLLSGLALRAVRRGDPGVVTVSQRVLRTIYRWLIDLAGLYYYLSLPLLVVLSIALPLTIAYALLNVPVVSLWLIAAVFIASIGSILTAVSGVRACFVVLDRTLPGRLLNEKAHPRLWKVAREVADHVGARAVDEIRLTPSAEIGVVEIGGFLARMRNQSRRVLFLGIGVLDGFSQRAFRSVLGHEYGHFCNRDTAGGEIALRVNIAMQKFAAAIVERGKIRWWDLAVHFLQFYYKAFNRLTFGASRLQEVLADRVAVLAYGPEALEEGLRHAIRRAVEFDYWIGENLHERLHRGLPPQMFAGANQRPNTAHLEHIEGAIAQAMARPTSEMDTHPSPYDRFAYAKRLNAENWPADGRMVWSLFDNAAALQQSVVKELHQALQHEAEIFRHVGDYHLRILNQVLRHSKDRQALEARAELRLQRGDYDRACEDYRMLLSLSPHSVSAGIGLAEALRSKQDYAAAITQLEHMLRSRQRTRRFDVCFMLGECLRDSGRLDTAVGVFSNALKLDKTAAGGYMARGRAHSELENWPEAAEDFTQAIALMPSNVDAYVERAETHLQRGDDDAALQDFRKAVSLGAAYPKAHYNYARLLLAAEDQQRDPKRALKHALAACGTPQKDAQALTVLADAYAANNDPANAAKTIKRLLRMEGMKDDPVWKQRLEELAEQRPTQELEGAEPDEEALPTPRLSRKQREIQRSGGAFYALTAAALAAAGFTAWAILYG